MTERTERFFVNLFHFEAAILLDKVGKKLVPS